MSRYQTPGVYYERVDASAPGIFAVRTDIAGFVGIAPRGPLDTPVPVESWRQFQAYFGDFTGAGYLAYAVRGFFENGGRRCWVVRVASQGAGGANTAGVTLRSPSGEELWRVEAFSPGSWGNDLAILLKETHRAQTQIVPGMNEPHASKVVSTSGFERGTLVRLSQGLTQEFKVVSDIDAIESRLVWVHKNPALRLPYDSPLLTNFDDAQPVFIESIEYTFLVKSDNRVIRQYGALSLVPEHRNYGPVVLAPFELSTDFALGRKLPSAPHPIVIEELRDFQVKGLPVILEPIRVETRTALIESLDPIRVKFASTEGVKAGTVFELLNPLVANAVVGERLKIAAIDPIDQTITLDGAGLLKEHLDAANAAESAGTHLRVRFRDPDINQVTEGLREWLLEGGADGLTLLKADDFIGQAISPLDSDQVKRRKRRGIRALETVDEVAIVAVPDIHIQPLRVPQKSPLPPCKPDPCLPQLTVSPAPHRTPAEMELPPTFSEEDLYRVQAALVQHCEERRDRIALLDPPFTTARNDELGVGAARAWRSRFDSKYAAFYYPWLRVVDPLRSAITLTRDIPPSGHVAGQYAQTDLQVGVHKAPANAPLNWTQDVTANIADAVHGLLNVDGINAIRSLPSRGQRILGARTLSSDPDWRYVNVRRLLMMIEKAIYLSMQWAVFEPNDLYTRSKLHLSLTGFLLALWQRGALMGAAANEAFFVKCDEENNPPSERGNGRLLAEVGVAPSQPFEFVVLRVGRVNNEFEITEGVR